MDKVIKTCLSPALDDNYLSKNNASTQVLYLNKRILSDFFQNENCCSAFHLNPQLQSMCMVRSPKSIAGSVGATLGNTPYSDS